MTCRKQRQKLLDDVCRFVSVFEVVLHIGKAEHFPFLALVDYVRVRYPSDRALSELHLIARESSSFVGEDVFDLAELFDEGRCAAERGRVCSWIVHIEIGIDEGCMLKFDHLHCYDETEAVVSAKLMTLLTTVPTHEIGIKLFKVKMNVKMSLKNVDAENPVFSSMRYHMSRAAK